MIENEVLEMYKAYFENLPIHQFGSIITVGWENMEYVNNKFGGKAYRSVKHTTSFFINSYMGKLIFASTTNVSREV